MNTIKSTQNKMVNVMKKAALTIGILTFSSTMVAQPSLASETPSHSYVSTQTAQQKFDRDFKNNQITLSSMGNVTSTLLYEYTRYIARTPVYQRSADDFYVTFYKTNPEMLRQVEYKAFYRNAEGILYTQGPKNKRYQGVYEAQLNSARQYKFYMETIQEYIVHNGDPSYIPLLEKLRPTRMPVGTM